MSWAGAGAGASEGLDAFLERELARQKFEQSQKEHTDDVSLKSRQLDQSGANQKSEAELRAQQTQDILDRRAEEERQRALRARLKTGATTQQQRDYVAMDDAGVKPPYELITEPNGPPKATPAGSIQKDASGFLHRIGADNSDTPVLDKNGKPFKGYQAPQAPALAQSDAGFFLVPRTGAGAGTATPVTTGKDKEQLPVKSPAQILQRQDMAGRVGSHFADLSSELDEAEKQGLLGPLAGRTVSDFLGTGVGSTGDPVKDELLGNLRMDLSGVVTGFGSLHGRGGANAGIAQKLALDAFNAKKMSHAELKGGVEALKKWVDGYAAPSHGSTAPDAAPAASDPYTDYLNRKK